MKYEVQIPLSIVVEALEPEMAERMGIAAVAEFINHVDEPFTTEFPADVKPTFIISENLVVTPIEGATTQETEDLANPTPAE